MEYILSERGVDICHETIRFWVNRFGGAFAENIGKKRRCHHSNWRWHSDEVFVKINGEKFLIWCAVDHEGEVLEAFVSKKRRRRTALKFTTIHGLIYNHCNHQRHLDTRQVYKQKRAAALVGWRETCGA